MQLAAVSKYLWYSEVRDVRIKLSNKCIFATTLLGRVLQPSKMWNAHNKTPKKSPSGVLNPRPHTDALVLHFVRHITPALLHFFSFTFLWCFLFLRLFLIKFPCILRFYFTTIFANTFRFFVLTAFREGPKHAWYAYQKQIYGHHAGIDLVLKQKSLETFISFSTYI